MTSAFKPIITGGQVRAAAAATMALWADTYVAELARQTGQSMAALRRYTATMNVDDPGNEYPAVVIVAPGILSTPERQGDGSHDALWALGVAVVVAAPNGDDAVSLCEAYTAAVRALFVQHGDLDGFATETTWLDEETKPVAYEKDRVVCAGQLQFEVLVSGVVNRFGGPLTPGDPTVPINSVPVATADFTLVKESLNG